MVGEGKSTFLFVERAFCDKHGDLDECDDHDYRDDLDDRDGHDDRGGLDDRDDRGRGVWGERWVGGWNGMGGGGGK